jgi:hypothetical protein
VVKRFAFHFVNQFSALLYAAFWQRDLYRVRSLLIFGFINHTVSVCESGVVTGCNSFYLDTRVPHCRLRRKCFRTSLLASSSGSQVSARRCV